MKLDALDEAVRISKPRTSGISSTMELEMSLVYPNPDQPRKHFDPDSLVELAESIKTHGLIQPISVVKRTAGYMIIAGERRYRAHQINGSLTIKATVTEKDDHAIEELALIENIQRDDLSDFEKAVAIGRMWASGRYKQKQDLARAINKPLSYISKSFSCLKLDETIRSDIEEGKRNIGLSVLEELSRIKDKEVQREVYDRYVSGEITRDQFSDYKPEKISLGKKNKLTKEVVTQQGEHGFLYSGDKFETAFNLKLHARYKITIEEIV